MKIFGREPALWLALVATTVQLVAAFVVHLTDEQQGALNFVAAAAVGIITAVAVAREKLTPAILGGVQAVIALGVAFGWHLSAGNQAILMSFAAAVVAMFVRTQVVAKVPPLE